MVVEIGCAFWDGSTTLLAAKVDVTVATGVVEAGLVAVTLTTLSAAGKVAACCETKTVAGVGATEEVRAVVVIGGADEGTRIAFLVALCKDGVRDVDGAVAALTFIAFQFLEMLRVDDERARRLLGVNALFALLMIVERKPALGVTDEVDPYRSDSFVGVTSFEAGPVSGEDNRAVRLVAAGRVVRDGVGSTVLRGCNAEDSSIPARGW